MTTPSFSVVVPLFDKAAHVGATLAAIAAQTVTDHEVIVVDDGSTDAGPSLVKAIARTDDRIKLVRQRNAGPGVARNRGIATARASWVAFCDADDLWHPDHLAVLAETIATCPDAAVVASGFARDAQDRLAAHPPGGPHVIDFFAEHHLIWTSAVAVRKDALADGAFGAAWPGEDVELWIRLALRHRFAVHPARTALYVQNTGGAMDSAKSTAIMQQPVFVTIAAILADRAHADRHQAVAMFRNRLLGDYIRPSLFNGQTALARAYVAALDDADGRVPPLYRVLARLPGPLVRSGARLYGRIRRQFAKKTFSSGVTGIEE